jgi:hypothetical protein
VSTFALPVGWAFALRDAVGRTGLNVSAHLRRGLVIATRVRFRSGLPASLARAGPARISLFFARLSMLLQPFMVFKFRGFP